MVSRIVACFKMLFEALKLGLQWMMGDTPANMRIRRSCILHSLSTSWTSLPEIQAAPPVGHSMFQARFRSSWCHPLNWLVENGICRELIVVTPQPEFWLSRCMQRKTNHTGMSLAEQTYRSHQQDLNVCNSTSHDMQLHCISHHFSQQTSKFLGISAQQHTWTLWSCPAAPWPKEKMLIWDKQQGDLLEELRKTCEAGGIRGQRENRGMGGSRSSNKKMVWDS